jgi:hypothetical protein
VMVVGGGRPRILATIERTRRIKGIDKTMLPRVERRLPKCSINDITAKNEEWVAVKVDSIIPAKDMQLSTTERTSAKAAKIQSFPINR